MGGGDSSVYILMVAALIFAVLVAFIALVIIVLMGGWINLIAQLLVVIGETMEPAHTSSWLRE